MREKRSVKEDSAFSKAEGSGIAHRIPSPIDLCLKSRTLGKTI